MPSAEDTESPSVMPNPKGGRRLRSMEGEVGRESEEEEEVAEGEAEKMSQMESGRGGGGGIELGY